jgi:hypothetical protein
VLLREERQRGPHLREQGRGPPEPRARVLRQPLFVGSGQARTLGLDDPALAHPRTPSSRRLGGTATPHSTHLEGHDVGDLDANPRELIGQPLLVEADRARDSGQSPLRLLDP